MFTILRASPRIVVYLKHIAEELRRANDLSEARMKLEDPNWEIKVGRKKGKMVEIDNPGVKDWNKVYREKNPALGED